jgi:archaemetzincin
MSALQLLRLGPFDVELANEIGEWMGEELSVPVELIPIVADPAFAFHPERQQYHSSEVLSWLERRMTEDTWRLLALTDVDLYIPILTYVFGEARLGPGPAVVSTRRLRPESYGLPAARDLLVQRLMRESMHELGHTLGLRHCSDWRCAMASSSDVAAIDVKSPTFCDSCRARAAAHFPPPATAELHITRR